jgi:hypothetical protein
VMAIPSRVSGWPPFLPPPSILFLAVIGCLRLTVGFGLVLALVVLFRRGRYGGPGRAAEWLALGLASLGLLDVVPNLDDMSEGALKPATYGRFKTSHRSWGKCCQSPL